MTDFWWALSSESRVRIGYAVAAVLTAILWLAQHGTPLEHALRLLAIMAVVMTTSSAVHWLAERRGKHLPRHPIGRFLLFKLALVAVALGTAVALNGVVPHLDVWVALGMAAVVAGVGPALHPWLMNQRDSSVTRDVQPAAR